MRRISEILKALPHLTPVLSQAEMSEGENVEKVSFAKWLVHHYCTASLESSLNSSNNLVKEMD